MYKIKNSLSDNIYLQKDIENKEIAERNKYNVNSFYSQNIIY